MEKLLTITEAAQRVGLSTRAMANHLEAGELPNAQRVGPRRWWVIPESDLRDFVRLKDRKWRGRVRLQRSEYEAAGLVVVTWWKHRPPRLRCPVCGQEWRGWEWRCPTGCNAEAIPQRGQVANPILKQARRARGLTQEQLAQAAGVTTGTVALWENRGTLPKPATRRRVAEFLGLDPWAEV